ncbi:hypothetical protein QBC46DRAFT_336892 [Diplogelasinospora grovesii]|uniref:Ribonucleases P/MRP subunit Pop8-like domain-containing protein n=1 Tax=Diplogelasinospora grovesii TaxID=303347 RepID=A0AAN6NGE8_9PEZI|nr:hypothetical protein QBC46DRAFT_336892 [Diplogelasinospora grovesii]
MTDMDVDPPENTQPPEPTPATQPTESLFPTDKKVPKPRELNSVTIRSPPFAYAHLRLVTDDVLTSGPSASLTLDALQVRSYCTSALRQFLGDTGTAISIDILSVSGRECWLRVPQPDLGALAAAITAYAGQRSDNTMMLLQLLACGDYLGSLLGKAEQHQLFDS